MTKPPAEKTANESRSDEELLAGYLSGENQCFDEIVKRYKNPITRVACRYLGGDMDTAADAAQQTFVRVFTHGKSFRREGSFKSWLFTIAVNQALTLARTRARRSEEPFTLPASTGVQSRPDSIAESSERAAILNNAVKKLPEKQRLVLTLRVDAELPFSQIAVIARMSEVSAKVNYHHAVVSLKKILGGGGNEV